MEPFFILSLPLVPTSLCSRFSQAAGGVSVGRGISLGCPPVFLDRRGLGSSVVAWMGRGPAGHLKAAFAQQAHCS